MAIAPEAEAGNHIGALQTFVKEGAFGLSHVVECLMRAIELEEWRRFKHPASLKTYENKTFMEFVTTGPLQGLGTTKEMLTRLCGNDPRALDALDRALQQRSGGGKNQHTERLVDNVNEAQRPAGNAAAYALRRLRKRAPEIHQRVVAGELSPHAGMVEAGLRKRPVPAGELRRWWAKATEAERAEFAAWAGLR